MKLRNLNFRQSKSERVGDSSYSNFKKGFVKMFKFKDKFKLNIKQNPNNFEGKTDHKG